MNPQWQKFLHTANAHLNTDGAVLDFGDPRDERRSLDELAVLTELAPVGMISVSGSQATDFLQGQLSNDIQRLDRARSCIAAWCDAKGRTRVIVRVLPNHTGYHLLLPRSLVEQTLKGLHMFVLRADVQLADVSDQHVRLGLFGQNAGEVIGELLTPPEPGHLATLDDGTTVLSCPGPKPHYVLMTPASNAIALWDRLATLARPVGYPLWQLATINAGLPHIQPQTAGQFIPQMLNLHWLGGIDFAKGCYPGQEIIARLQYRGQLKQRVFRVQIDGCVMPAPGERITNAAGQNQGTVLQATGNGDTQMVLAVVRTEATASALWLADRPIQVLSLPYNVTC